MMKKPFFPLVLLLVLGLLLMTAMVLAQSDSAPPAPPGRITTLAVGPDGTLWAGVSGLGLYRLHQDAWEAVYFDVDGQATTWPDIQALWLDETGEMWLGTTSSGLIHFDGQTIHTFTDRNSLSDRFIGSMARTPDGALWVATRSGLARYEGNQWQRAPYLGNDTMRDSLLQRLARMRPEFALLSVVFLTLFAAVVGYASWSTAVRWHMRQQAVERRFNPYIAGTPIRSQEMFFGRDDLLQNAEAGLAHNSLMIYGERRIGKTSLLYKMLHDLRQMQDDKFIFFPIFVDLEGTLEEDFFHHLMEGLLEGLSHELDDFQAHQKLQYLQLGSQQRYTDRHMRRDLRQIVSHLKANHERTPRIIFLLDEADVLSTYSSLTQQQLRRILQDVFARNVGVVIAGVHISKAWDLVESPWYNMFVELVTPPLNRYESELLMRQPVFGFYEWDEAAVDFIWQRTAGRPHRIQQIAREAVNLMLDDQRRRIELADVRLAYERIVFAETH
jgi:AraC-like DNA-binding protein